MKKRNETYNPEKIKKDKWAMKAIQYLVRMDYSSKEVIDLMAEIGIKKGKVEDERVNL